MSRTGYAFLFSLLPLLVTVLPAPSRAGEGSTGLPLPRFASTRSDPINVRVGPGTRYDLAWKYLKPGVPVEIVQEFDTWRKIRDLDGSEGWVHQNLLSGRRAAYVAGPTPDPVPLLAGSNDTAGVRAYLPTHFRVDVDKCDGQWCEVNATDHPENGRPTTYSGYLKQTELWGVYSNETFD